MGAQENKEMPIIETKEQKKQSQDSSELQSKWLDGTSWSDTYNNHYHLGATGKIKVTFDG